jgi:hypothetical protein
MIDCDGIVWLMMISMTMEDARRVKKNWFALFSKCLGS